MHRVWVRFFTARAPFNALPLPLDPSVEHGFFKRCQLFLLYTAGAARVPRRRPRQRVTHCSPRRHGRKEDVSASGETVEAQNCCRATGRRAVAELGHVCFCHAVDVEGVGRVWTPAEGDDPLRALFRVISSSKAFYAAQKHTAALW